MRDLEKSYLKDDQGTRLGDGSWALVWHPEEGWSLCTPVMPSADDVPEEALAITACMLRLEREPEFRAEMAAWFEAQGKN